MQDEKNKLKKKVLEEFSSWEPERQLSEYLAYRTLGSFSPFDEDEYRRMQMIMENHSVELLLDNSNGFEISAEVFKESLQSAFKPDNIKHIFMLFNSIFVGPFTDYNSFNYERPEQNYKTNEEFIFNQGRLLTIKKNDTSAEKDFFFSKYDDADLKKSSFIQAGNKDSTNVSKSVLHFIENLTPKLKKFYGDRVRLRKSLRPAFDNKHSILVTELMKYPFFIMMAYAALNESFNVFLSAVPALNLGREMNANLKGKVELFYKDVRTFSEVLQAKYLSYSAYVSKDELSDKIKDIDAADNFDICFNNLIDKVGSFFNEFEDFGNVLTSEITTSKNDKNYKTPLDSLNYKIEKDKSDFLTFKKQISDLKNNNIDSLKETLQTIKEKFNFEIMISAYAEEIKSRINAETTAAIVNSTNDGKIAAFGKKINKKITTLSSTNATLDEYFDMLLKYNDEDEATFEINNAVIEEINKFVSESKLEKKILKQKIRIEKTKDIRDETYISYLAQELSNFDRIKNEELVTTRKKLDILLSQDPIEKIIKILEKVHFNSGLDFSYFFKAMLEKTDDLSFKRIQQWYNISNDGKLDQAKPTANIIKLIRIGFKIFENLNGKTISLPVKNKPGEKKEYKFDGLPSKIFDLKFDGEGKGERIIEFLFPQHVIVSGGSLSFDISLNGQRYEVKSFKAGDPIKLGKEGRMTNFPEMMKLQKVFDNLSLIFSVQENVDVFKDMCKYADDGSDKFVKLTGKLTTPIPGGTTTRTISQAFSAGELSRTAKKEIIDSLGLFVEISKRLKDTKFYYMRVFNKDTNTIYKVVPYDDSVVDDKYFKMENGFYFFKAEALNREIKNEESVVSALISILTYMPKDVISSGSDEISKYIANIWGKISKTLNESFETHPMILFNNLAKSNDDTESTSTLPDENDSKKQAKITSANLFSGGVTDVLTKFNLVSVTRGNAAVLPVFNQTNQIQTSEITS